MKAPWLLALVMAANSFSAAASAQPSHSPALDRLENDLHLTPSQAAAWDSFAKAYSVDPQEIEKRRQAQSTMPTLNGPQRVDLAITFTKEDLAGLQRRGDALKAFYATLTPDQQRIFDRDTLPPGPNR